MKTRFAMVGCGWRAQFYIRAVRMVPGEFEITSIVTRNEQRAGEISARTGIPAVCELEKALETKPDFVLLCVPREVMKDWIVRLMKRKIPVLCETPPGKDIGELNQLWKEKVRLGGNVQVTEQYFLQPYYSAVIRLARSGLLGEISNMNMSAIHGYHAVSIFRKVLGIGCQLAGLYVPNPEAGSYGLLPDFSGIFSLNFRVVIFAFLFVDMFDTIGTFIGVSSKAGMLDEEGRLPRIKGAGHRGILHADKCGQH